MPIHLASLELLLLLEESTINVDEAIYSSIHLSLSIYSYLDYVLSCTSSEERDGWIRVSHSFIHSFLSSFFYILQVFILSRRITTLSLRLPLVDHLLSLPPLLLLFSSYDRHWKLPLQHSKQRQRMKNCWVNKTLPSYWNKRYSPINYTSFILSPSSFIHLSGSLFPLVWLGLVGDLISKIFIYLLLVLFLIIVSIRTTTTNIWIEVGYCHISLMISTITFLQVNCEKEREGWFLFFC